MRRSQQLGSIGLAFLVTLWLVSAVAVLGAAVSPVAADQHTYDEAQDLDDSANFTINFPFAKDHYPGDQNEENGSIEYFSSGADAYKEVGAEEGIWASMTIVQADWIDYTACGTSNTYVFGIDRGNNNSGVKTDSSLLEHRKDDNFRDDGIDVYFYSWEDFGGDPPYLAPEDAIIAAQGWRSDGGPCLTLTSEPGWYQMQGFLNGTIANGDCTEEGNNDCKPENEEHVGVRVKSNYLYVCECDSEEEAREKLGPPPNEQTTSDTPTPTPEDTDDATPTPTSSDDSTPTPTPDDTDDATPTPTATQSDDGGGGGEDTQSQSNDDGGGGGGGDDGGNATPTPGEGPGFGPIVAIIALLATALLANRRR